ncbi:MAG: hypothetical protein AAF519_09915 [Bacteroidota bacterium]
MRLFQLARKLATTPDHLVSILAEHNYTIENKSNTKLTVEHEELLKNLFATNDEVIVQESAGMPDEVSATFKLEPQEETLLEEEELKLEEPLTSPTDEFEEAANESSTEDEIEVIRVKKVKLDGPKVVGKIDLPEPVVKARGEVREKEKHKKHKERNPRRKPARRTPTPEQLRQREQRAKDRKRKEEEQKKKKNRAKFYKENIQLRPEPTLKAKKKKQVETSHEISSEKVKVQKHKNPVKRLWAWLNGEYDNF